MVVILFNPDGTLRRALEVPDDVAKEHGVANSHQSGWVIAMNQRFLSDRRSSDITAHLADRRLARRRATSGSSRQDRGRAFRVSD